jgi:hypothetical protein
VFLLKTLNYLELYGRTYEHMQNKITGDEKSKIKKHI